MVFVALVAALGSVPGAPAFARGAPTPSAKARMICADEAQEDLAGVLAVRAKVTTPTWRHRTYRCTYRYANGSFDISPYPTPIMPRWVGKTSIPAVKKTAAAPTSTFRGKSSPRRSEI